MEYEFTPADKAELRTRIEKVLTPGRWVAYCDFDFRFQNVNDFPVPMCFDKKIDGIAWMRHAAAELGYKSDPARARHYRIIDGEDKVTLEAMALPSAGGGIRRWHIRRVPDNPSTLIDVCVLKATPKLQFYRFLDTL